MVTHMAVRRALEDCVESGDTDLYNEIVIGTDGWNTFDDLYREIKLKR